VLNLAHIGESDFFGVHPGMGGTGNLDAIEAGMIPSAKALFDDIVWWAKATMAAKAA